MKNDIAPLVKSCSTCEHREGFFNNLAECTYSGYLCSVTRSHNAGCGKDYEGWVKRRGVIQRIKEYF